MGYSHYAEISRDLTCEEFEILTTDARVIVKAAGEAGIALCGDASWEGHDGVDEVIINSDEIMLNGVGDESAESLHITRERRLDDYSPVTTFCKTYRRNYSPVVEAVMIALKQVAPHAVRIASDGRWGYEWLHGSACTARYNQAEEECPNADPGHVRLGGRTLYWMAFPSSPEPMNAFESPLTGTVYESQTIHMPRKLDCRRWGTSFVGLPFGVTLSWLLDQARRRPDVACTLCGEETETWAVSAEEYYNWNTPLCDFCLRERILSGKLYGYTFAVNPFRLAKTPQLQLN